MSPLRKKRRKWPYILLLLLIGSAVVGYGYYRNNAKLKPDLKNPEYRTGKAELGDIQVIVKEVGTIEPARSVDVKPSLSGKVTAIKIREGDTVTKGTILAVVEPEISQARSLSQIKSNLTRAQIELKDAETNYKSAQQLFRDGFFSSEQYQQSKLRYENAKESYNSAFNEYSILKEQGIPIELSGSAIQPVNVEAPQDGVVIHKNIQVGEMVMSGTSSFNAGTIMFVVADLSEMIIKASINEIDIGKIKVGQQVKIRVDAFPRVPFEGHISYISPAAKSIQNETIKVFDIEVALDKSGGELRSGMTANIDIYGEKREQVLTVPIESIFTMDERDIIYVKRQEPLPEPTPEPTKEPSADAEKKPPAVFTGKKFKPADDWKRFVEERDAKIGLIGTDKVEILEGVAENEQVLLENPSAPLKDKETMFR